MPFNLFSWLRRRTTESILLGAGDAAEFLGDDDEGQDHKLLKNLRDRLAGIPRLELQKEERNKR